MTEMYEASDVVGQFAINNQPSHHIVYMFIAAGCRHDGQYWIRGKARTRNKKSLGFVSLLSYFI